MEGEDEWKVKEKEMTYPDKRQRKTQKRWLGIHWMCLKYQNIG